MLQQKEYKAGDKVELILDENLANQLNCLAKLDMDDDVQIAGLIFVSNEYDKISKLTGNRDVVPRNIEKKKELISKHGFKTTNPIIVDMSGAIIDGQHRKEASKELDVPFKFMIDTDTTDALQTAIVFNTSTLNWNMQNFVDAYAQNGNDNYVKLLQLQEELEENILTVLLLYHTDMTANYSAAIKEGRFTYNTDKADRAREIYLEWQQLIDATEKNAYKQIVKGIPFLRAYLFMRKQENFVFDNLLYQFNKMYYTELNPRDVKESIFDVYNFKRRNRLEYKKKR